jgi:hypothetical protein
MARQGQARPDSTKQEQHKNNARQDETEGETGKTDISANLRGKMVHRHIPDQDKTRQDAKPKTNERWEGEPKEDKI